MVSLFQCELCHSKILENHLQKHHAKVHAAINYDIYTPVTTNGAPSVPSKADADTNAVIDRFKSIAPPPAADEKMVHIACNICGNRMPSQSLDQHMKRKHIDAGDQVDAVGIQTKVNSMTISVMEKSENPKVMAAAAAATAAVTAIDAADHPQKQSQEHMGATEWTTNWPKTKNPFSKSFQFTAAPKTDASTTTDTEAFYTIRVSVDQMKQLMSQNRIEPKDGYFYLK